MQAVAIPDRTRLNGVGPRLPEGFAAAYFALQYNYQAMEASRTQGNG